MCKFKKIEIGKKMIKIIQIFSENNNNNKKLKIKIFFLQNVGVEGFENHLLALYNYNYIHVFLFITLGLLFSFSPH